MLGFLLELAINAAGLLFWQDEARNSRPVRLKIRRDGPSPTRMNPKP